MTSPSPTGMSGSGSSSGSRPPSRGWRNGLPNWKGRPNPADAWSEAQSRPETGPAQGATPASPPRLCPDPHDAHPVGGARGRAMSRLWQPVVWGLDPSHSRTIAKSFHTVESASTRLSRESGNPQVQPWSPAISEAVGANRTTLQSSCIALGRSLTGPRFRYRLPGTST